MSPPSKGTSWKITAEVLKSLKSSKERISSIFEKFLNFHVFLKSANLVCERERWFLKYKGESCESIAKDKAPVDLSRKRKPSENVGDPTPKRVHLGNPSLDELWNITSDNVDCFKDDSYSHVPVIEVPISMCGHLF